MRDDVYRVFFICEESLSLFPGADHAPRFGGAGLSIYNLAETLAEDPEFEVNFVFNTPVGNARSDRVNIIQRRAPINRGLPLVSRQINRARRCEPYEGGGRKVIISTMAPFAPQLIEEARLADAKSIFRVASETDVYDPRGVAAGDKHVVLESIRACDAVVVQSEEQRVRLHETLEKDSTVIRKGIPVGPMPAAQGKSGILWVASAQMLKQPWYFLDLARLFPSESFTMIMPPAESNVSAYVRRTVEELPNVTLIDRQVPIHEVQHYFDEAKIFIYTSEFGTDPANTLLQAGAGGCAILSERLDPDGGMFSVHGAGVTCGADFRLMIQVLGEWLGSPHVVDHYGKAAYTYIRDRYNLSASVGQYKELIHRLHD